MKSTALLKISFLPLLFQLPVQIQSPLSPAELLLVIYVSKNAPSTLTFGSAVYAAQLKNSHNRRDSSEERDPPSGTSFRNDSSMSNLSNAKTCETKSNANETSDTTKSTEKNSNSKVNSTASQNSQQRQQQEPKHQKRRRKKRNPQKQGSHEQMLDSIAEKG